MQHRASGVIGPAALALGIAAPIAPMTAATMTKVTLLTMPAPSPRHHRIPTPAERLGRGGRRTSPIRYRVEGSDRLDVEPVKNPSSVWASTDYESGFLGHAGHWP